MKKIALILSLSCFLSAFLEAQVKYGINAGIDYSTIVLKRSYPSDQDLYGVPGYHLGFNLNLPINNNLSITTGLSVSKKGFIQKSIHPFKSPILEYDSITKFNVSYYYLDLPVLLEFKTKFNKMDVQFGVGPYLSYGIAGKANLSIDSHYSDYSYSETVQWKPYFAMPTELGPQMVYDYAYTQIKRFDYGIITRFGLSFDKIAVNAEYRYGLANILSAFGINEKMKHHSLGLSITYYLKK